MSERSGIQIAAWVLAAVLLLAAGWRLLSPGQGGEAAPVRLDRAPAAASARRGGGEVYVHVAGAVRRPGLYRVPRSARVAAALERARGPTSRADLTAVNLAARVADGQQIVVPREGAAAASPNGAAASGAGGGSAPTVSLATATIEQLDGLDGIGPTLARRIIEYRESHGGFRSVQELREVDGIGEKRFAALREAVRP